MVGKSTYFKKLAARFYTLIALLVVYLFMLKSLFSTSDYGVVLRAFIVYTVLSFLYIIFYVIKKFRFIYRYFITRVGVVTHIPSMFFLIPFLLLLEFAGAYSIYLGARPAFEDFLENSYGRGVLGVYCILVLCFVFAIMILSIMVCLVRTIFRTK